MVSKVDYALLNSLNQRSVSFSSLDAHGEKAGFPNELNDDMGISSQFISAMCKPSGFQIARCNPAGGQSAGVFSGFKAGPAKLFEADALKEEKPTEIYRKENSLGDSLKAREKWQCA